jgi:CheY-like chemotaxis protein
MDCEGLPAGPELTVCQAARAAAEAAEAAQKLAEGESLGETIVAVMGAIGALALPILAIVVVVKVWPILRDLFETRKFTLKIGGFELSAQEATDQIRKQIEELQGQIDLLKSTARSSGVMHESAVPEAAASEPAETSAPLGRAHKILWVDDKPSNNAFLIADFQDRGIVVDQALSTNEAMQKLASRSGDYRVIISDLGRTEANRYVADAGKRLASEIRAVGLATPMAIFSSARAAADRDLLIQAGATAVTNNSTRLRSWVLQHFQERAN